MNLYKIRLVRGKLAPAVTHVTCITEVHNLNFSLDTECPDRYFAIVPSPSMERQSQYLRLGDNCFKSSGMLCCVKWQKVTKILKIKTLWPYENLTMMMMMMMMMILPNILYATPYTHFYELQTIYYSNENTNIQGYSKWLSGFLQLVTHNTLEIAVYVFFLFNRTTLQVFVTYLTGALYVHPLWFYKHKHNNHHCWHATNSFERTRLSCWWL